MSALIERFHCNTSYTCVHKLLIFSIQVVSQIKWAFYQDQPVAMSHFSVPDFLLCQPDLPRSPAIRFCCFKVDIKPHELIYNLHYNNYTHSRMVCWMRHYHNFIVKSGFKIPHRMYVSTMQRRIRVRLAFPYTGLCNITYARILLWAFL